MKTKLLFFIGISILLVSCQNNKKDKRFLITKNSVGLLTKDTRVNQLDSVFAQDSVVQDVKSTSFSNDDDIIIYNKDGEMLLKLQPVNPFDSTSTIANVQIMDTIYKTEDGLGLGSEFKVLKEKYSISRIENTLLAAVVFSDELNAYFNISKKDILEPTEMGAKIKTSQIKDEAEIKHFWIGWN